MPEIFHVDRSCSPCCGLSSDIRGGFSRGVPPLPIPNRAVKPARADGTDTPVGRVGRRRTSGSPGIITMPGLLSFLSSAISCVAKELFLLYPYSKESHVIFARTPKAESATNPFSWSTSTNSVIDSKVHYGLLSGEITPNLARRLAAKHCCFLFHVMLFI